MLQEMRDFQTMEGELDLRISAESSENPKFAANVPLRST